MATFVDLDLDTEEGDGFHCEKAHTGPLTVSHPVAPGKTYIIDYMLKSDGTWQYIRTAYTGGNVTIGGEGMTVSNVRIYPEDTMPESFAWRRFSGMSARIDAHGVTESYVYDDAGRLSEVRENNGNTLKSHSYAYGDGATVTTKEFTSEDGIENRTSLRSYDGLGRLVLNTMKEGSPTGEDIIIRHEYDVMDRRIKTWLPAVSSGTPYEMQSDDAFPYDEFIYESSPLDRLLSKYGPGEAWRDSDKAVHTAQMTNVSEQGNIRYHRGFNISWSGATLTLKINTSHTATGRFIIEKTIDEDDRIRLEFKNIYGETVLIRTILDNGSWIDTHFIYDAFGRLAAVLPPKLTAQLESSGKTTWTESEISALAFLYRYDNRGNCIARSLPDGRYVKSSGQNSGSC